MALPRSLPTDFATTRDSLHRVAVHVLARARHAATGRIGLRTTAGGFGTPAFGAPGDEVVLRIGGGMLIAERSTSGAMHSDVHPLAGSSLGALATFVGIDLNPTFSVGTDTPPLGDPDAELRVDPDAVEVMATWLLIGATAVDRLLVSTGREATPTVAQLWPEHFDLAFDLATGTTRANVGVSFGDRFHATPYAYVGPWDAARPGDQGYWNAPFGALLGFERIVSADEPSDAIGDFFRTGIAHLRRGDGAD